MFQANAFQVNAFQIGDVAGVPPIVADEVRGNKGGWDPYYYKPRRKKAKKREEVDRFLSETAQLETAPAPVQEAAEVARDAVEDYLAALHQASQREAQRLLAEALDRIDAFYEAAKRAADDEDDDDLLLLM